MPSFVFLFLFVIEILPCLAALRYAIAADRTGLKMLFLEKNLCEMTIVPETFYPSGYAVGLPQNSPYRAHFNRL